VKKKQQIIPLAYHFYILPITLICLIGFFSSAYLAHVHYKNYTDITFSSVCAISKAINCDTVAQSSLSILFSLPLAYYSIFCFLLLSILILSTWRKRQLTRWWLIFFIAVCCSLASLYFGYLSAAKIKSYCIFCLTCYGCFFAITFYSFIIIKRFKIEVSWAAYQKTLLGLFRDKVTVSLILLLLCSLFSLQRWIPHYWQLEFASPDQEIASGFTEDHHPWIGAEQPQLVIHEYTDYLCFQCYKMHFFLRQLVEQYPDAIRIVHHNFPLDHLFNPVVGTEPYHVGAGKMALVAIRMAEQEKFWQLHDELYKIARQGKVLDLAKLGEKININPDYLASAFYDPGVLNLLKKDIYRGIQQGIIVTPSFVIEDNTYSGTLPEDILDRILQQESHSK